MESSKETIGGLTLQDVNKMTLQEIIDEYKEAKEIFHGSSFDSDTTVRILKELIDLKKEIGRLKKCSNYRPI